MPRRTSRARATLADVAAAAGVSVATVSKALNGRDDVAVETRERVLSAVSDLGYRSSTSPAVRDHAALAVVFDIPASPYILNLLQGVLSSSTELGLNLLNRLAPERPERVLRSTARQWVAAQQEAGVIGIVGLTLSEPDALLDAAADARLPFVIVDPVDTCHPKMVSVGSSNWAGARAATEHLIALGHRRIAWVGGPDASDAARDRFYGYQAALDNARIPTDTSLVRSGTFEVSEGMFHAHELLTSSQPPTAIMAADDELAVGVLAAAHGLGIDVPGQLSVTGFDDTPQAAWTTPPLTTVHQHLEEMGRVAVQTVAAMADGHPPASRHLELATSLTIRATTGEVPGGTEPA